MTKDKAITQRIKQIIDTLYEGNKSSFARAIGVGESGVRSYLSGTIPKADVLEKIAENTAISCEWLLTGKGNMEKGIDFGHSEASSVVNPTLEDKLLGIISQQAEKIGRLETEIEYLKRKEKFGRPDAEAAGVADVG